MKIVLFTQEDPFYVREFFQAFLERVDGRDEIQAVVISRPMGKRSATALARQMYGFYGPRDFLRMGVRYVRARVASRLGNAVPRVLGAGAAATIAGLVRARGIEVIERSDLNSPAFRDLIGSYQSDLFVSVASPVIFRQELLAIPRICCVNIHNAPLPRYRGMMPNFWQLYHGEQETGITVHRMAREVDGGDVIRQEFLPVRSGESLDSLIRRTKRRNAELLREVLDDFRAGRVTYTPIAGEGSYFTFPTREEVREFRHRGGRLL